MRIVIAFFAALACVLPSWAHETWLEPHAARVEPGAEIRADLLNGQQFSGAPIAYLPHRLARFELFDSAGRREVGGRIGDLPAYRARAAGESLAILVAETRPARLTYDDFETFEAFVRHKGFAEAAARHRARGLPESGFEELFSRSIKALVAVGDGRGADRRVGLETEIVLLANPYRDDLAAGLPVQALFGGEPKPFAQIEVFSRAADGAVEVEIVKADATGRATISASSGRDYLLDSVTLRPIEQGGAVWRSYWAASVFSVP